MRALAMTGMVTASLMPSIISGSDMRATPPSTRMSAGTRSSAMTATAPASSAILGLLGGDDVHDDAALEHLGQPPLDAIGPTLAGAGRGRGGVGVVRSGHGIESTGVVRPDPH